MAGRSGQGAWVHLCAWPWSDTHRACAGVTWSLHRSTSGLCLETGSESQACSRRTDFSGWVISHGERAGLGGLSSEHPWPLPAFGGFPFISFQQVLPSCRSPCLHGNVSRGHRRHRSFAVPAGGLFEGRTSLTQGSAADRLPCVPRGPTFHFSAHPCPHCADTVPVAALSSSSHHPEVPVEGTGDGCVGAGTLQRWEMPRFLQARVPQARHHPVPRGPQQCRPQHRFLAQAAGLALRSQPLPANTMHLPQLFPIVQAPEPCQRGSPGCTPAVTPRQRPTAPWLATCAAPGQAPKPSAPSRDLGAVPACTGGA